MSTTLLAGDCREVMAGLPESTFDAIVTDPPYGLEFMGKEWDRLDTAHAKRDRADELSDPSKRPYLAHSVGYQGGSAAQEFHGSWAREALRVLKPGGHLVAFGGTRTFHRLTCALEDAGFEIRDCLCWLYGVGFPKSLNLDGAHAGWGTALKPAWEPIILARKPLSEKNVAANVAKWGTGAINVDGCRIPGTKPVVRPIDSENRNNPILQTRSATGTGEVTNEGRWPANVALDEEAARLLDEQSGERPGLKPTTLRRGETTGTSIGGNGKYGTAEPHTVEVGYGDSGGASRFFYTAKASPDERGAFNNHPTVKPVALMAWLLRLVVPTGGSVLDPFLGSGTTAVAAREQSLRFTGIEREAAYLAIARKRLSQQVFGMEPTQ